MCIFFHVILKTKLLSHHLSKCNSKFWFLALFCISLERLDRILFKPHQIIVTMCITISETKSASQLSLFWRYANFSKLMRTALHFSTFQFEFYCTFSMQNIENIRTKANEKYRYGLRKTVSKHPKVFLKLALTLVFWA